MSVVAVERTLVSYVPEGTVLWLRHLRGRPLRRGRPHEPELGLVGALGDSPSVVDVGGNRGQTIQSVRSVRPGSRIESFEPNPRLAAWLERRYAGPHVHIHGVGLGAEDADTVLHVPYYGRVGFDTRASLDDDTARSFLSAENFAAFDPRRGRIEAVPIRIRRLDDQQLAPDLLKIDVEGTEDAVVDGGWETIAAHRPLLIVESASPDLVRRLAPLTYVPHRWEGRGLVRGTGGGRNTVFVSDAHRDALRLFVAA